MRKTYKIQLQSEKRFPPYDDSAIKDGPVPHHPMCILAVAKISAGKCFIRHLRKVSFMLG